MLELHCVPYIKFFRIGMTGKKTTTKSCDPSSNTNNKYFSQPSNLMRVRKISWNKSFYSLYYLSVIKKCILTNDQLERVICRPYPAVDPSERAIVHKFSLL